MPSWNAFPHPAAYRFSNAELEQQWTRLHQGDAEPLPDDARVLAAWALFHSGEFQRAAHVGLQAGGAGITVANKAQAVHATYLEPSEQVRLALFLEVAERAEVQAACEPGNANAHYLLGYALGRHGQATSVAEAVAHGVGSKIRRALEQAIALQPRHADAHIALGTFHAEVIDKVGSLLGRTQGASKDSGLALFKAALRLNPNSPIAMIACANGMVMLEGDQRIKEATRLYEQAAACAAADALEWLDIEVAKAELED